MQCLKHTSVNCINGGGGMDIPATAREQLGGRTAARATAGGKSAEAASADLVSGVMDLIQRRGLGTLVDGFRKGGLASAAASWGGTGANEDVTGEQVHPAPGTGIIAAIAARVGISTEQASEVMSTVVPGIVDHPTSNGRVEEVSYVERGFAVLKGKLGL